MNHKECIAYVKSFENGMITYYEAEDESYGVITLRVDEDTYTANLQVGASCWWDFPTQLGDLIVNLHKERGLED